MLQTLVDLGLTDDWQHMIWTCNGFAPVT